MTELERGRDARRKRLQKCIEHRQVLLEIRRQLEQQRAELGPERRGGVDEYRRRSAQSLRRASCVIRFGALSVSLNRSGVRRSSRRGSSCSACGNRCS